MHVCNFSPFIDFDVGGGLSVGAIVGIVLASCVILVLILVFLRMNGYLGKKDLEDKGKINHIFFNKKKMWRKYSLRFDGYKLQVGNRIRRCVYAFLFFLSLAVHGH